MRLFYGMKPGPSGVKEGENLPTESGDPLDIGKTADLVKAKIDKVDSPGFNANTFLQDLAVKSSLEELMKKGSELAAGELIRTKEPLSDERRGRSTRLETCAGL
jgi:hypothetical protein